METSLNVIYDRGWGLWGWFVVCKTLIKVTNGKVDEVRVYSKKKKYRFTIFDSPSFQKLDIVWE